MSDIIYTGDGDFTFTEEWGARSPGWYRVTCDNCDYTTTGTESVVEDVAHEHECPNLYRARHRANT